MRNCVKISHHVYILQEKNHAASSECHGCSLAHMYVWLDDKGGKRAGLHWGGSDGHDLAVKVGRKVIDVRSLAGYKS